MKKIIIKLSKTILTPTNFFRIAIALMFFGVILSLLSLLSPRFFDKDLIESAGSISAGIAAVFSIGIAILALAVYIHNDSPLQKIADQSYTARQQLADALYCAALLRRVIKVTLHEDYNSPVFIHMLNILKDALADARKTPIYSAVHNLSNESKSDLPMGFNVAELMLYLEAHANADLKRELDGIGQTYHYIFYLYNEVIKINEKNIRDLANEDPNDRNDVMLWLKEDLKRMQLQSKNNTETISHKTINDISIQNKKMTPQEQLQRGTNLIQEFAAFSQEEKSDFPNDLDCLKLWLKAKLHEYGANIENNQEMRAAISLALDAAYRLGK